MSRRKATKTKRDELLKRLWDLGRKVSRQTVFLHQAIAQTVGLNATDAKVIDLILRGPQGQVTPGWLSRMAGLTTGAIAHILDRLEKQKFIERLRDTTDRRKVFARVLPERLEPLIPQCEAMGKAYLSLVADYLEKTCEVSERELANFISSVRTSPSPQSRPRRRGPGQD